ncbi:MAG: ECF transporter S component [Bacilli bacterium]|nr:ECF transporter S component [Bacilli bacterium]
MKTDLKNIVLTSLFIALGYVITLPFRGVMVGGIPLGTIFSPMHLPIFICGLLCGWKYGLISGLITPLLVSILGGMPPLLPSGVVMSVELGTYGLISGLLYHQLLKIKHPTLRLYASLIIAMLVGRIIYLGAMGIVITLGTYGAYRLDTYLETLFIVGSPAIAIQLVFVPLIVRTIQTRLFPNETTQ